MDQAIFALALVAALSLGGWLLWGLLRRLVSLAFWAGAVAAVCYGLASINYY